MFFYSKKSVFHIIFVIIAIFILFIPIIFFDNIFGFYYYIIAGVVSLFFISTIFFVFYKIDEVNGKLTLWFLFVKLELKIDRIKSISRVKNLKLSYSTSFKKLKIDYSLYKSSRWTNLYISPSKEIEFINLLKKINPDINTNGLEEV